MDKPKYMVQRKAGLGVPDWDAIRPLDIAFFWEKSSTHRPHTQARVMYNDQTLLVRFDVQDRYVKAVAENYQDPVCKDSCVEFFVQPKRGGPYFNFEVNVGGTMLLYCIPVSDNGEAQMKQAQKVPLELVQGMNIQHSMPSRIEKENEESCRWTVEYSIPFALFERYLGALGPVAGQIWHANFYKCADATSHPHWGMWSPILDGHRFHRPDYFGEIIFER